MTHDTVLAVAAALGLLAQPLFLAYFLAYNGYMLTLIALSARQVRRRVAGHFIEDLDLIDQSDYTKPLTMVVPAFNEEVTIVDSVTNLLHCDYPRFEVVVVNDGSSDRTLEVLKQAFRLRRTDLPYRDAIGTARVRAMYEATVPLPPNVMQMVVIDKENAGKADALNAGINASTCPYFVSLDADSILDEHALKELMRMIQEDPRIVAVGGQVAIANGCTIRGGKVISVGLPSHPWARFQMVEYLRSFTTGRTGLDRLDCILILSGVFAVFEKETVIRAGGYLTPLVQHKIVEEYVGPRAGTVCEDMEIIVRLHRFMRDKLRNRRIAFLPHPVAWTEVPERLESLRKQRGRWYRGLRESLFYHRDMLFRRKFGRIGWFALPTFWVFEYYGPIIEALGYSFVAAFLLAEWALGVTLLNKQYAVAFLLASLGWGMLVNIFAVLVGAWRFRFGLADRLQRGLLPFNRRRDVLILLGYAVLENFFWRWLTLYWRLRGLWDAWRGKIGWEKFARQGFQKQPEVARAA
ncbi:MAG TPA: glycosyltransferase [Gemmatimonadales bacterium]|jgi:cellulose synthase/poly-beta-1,6-N-acetylglucosamine synthase-like glycosyltransferase|nr:glycosyltransferase [Gemmatimonadales bacterium]